MPRSRSNLRAPEGRAGELAVRYRAETQRLIAARLPVAMLIFFVLMTLAYVIDGGYHPERWRVLALSYAGFVAIALGTIALRRQFPRWTIEIVLAGCVLLAVDLVAYIALMLGSGELCLVALAAFLTGEVVQFPWGVRGQLVSAVVAIALYLAALSAGAQATIELPYALFALSAHAVMTVVGAHVLESHRSAAFREAAEAARANAAKSEFLATVSHELRTPLHIIVGYTDLLLDGAFAQPTEQRDALDRIRQQSHQLLDLIQSMLDLNRMEAGGISLVIEEFSIAAALEHVRAGLPDTWCQPGVALHWQVDGVTATMRSDRGKLESILRNVIHNALKYTETGSVTVQAQTDHQPGWVEFTVRDTGQGIAAEDLSGIFDMFRQGSGGPPRGGGVGLGLYIAKRLTTALGGQIAAESEIDAGSRFTVSLPRMAPGAGTQPAEQGGAHTSASVA